MTQEPNDVTR